MISVLPSKTEIDIVVKDKQLAILKNTVWVYFMLLIFEGALRKWFLPSLATPILIIRDPIAIFMIVKAIQYQYFKPNLFVIIAWVVSVISLFATLFWGHGNVYVAIYGLRIMAIHFPLIFVIGVILDKKNVIIIGKALLWIHIGMTILVAIQFYSPQTAWVNRGVGGDMDGSGFGATGDFFRVPGTFSFTNGLSFFYGLVVVFVFYLWLDTTKISIVLLMTATVCMLAAIPLSVSRTVLFEVLLSLLFALITTFRKPKNLLRFLGAGFVVTLLFIGLSFFPFFQTSIEVFMQRFSEASMSEGGLEGTLIDRFLGGMVNALANNGDLEFFGKGLGMGTNVGSQLLSGTRTFLISEGEWGRLIGETGIFIGFIMIIMRLILVTVMFKKAWNAIKANNYLPWMLSSFAMLLILQGAWAQPTTLGFAVMAGGMLLASLKD